MTGGSARTKVLHVINSIGLGGVPEAAYQILSRLSAEVYDRHLVVMRNLNEEDTSRVARFERFKTLDLPITFLKPSEHKLGVVTQLVDILAAGEFDVLHCHSHRPNLFARLAGTLFRPRGLAIVAHYHNQYDPNWNRDGTRPLDRELGRATDAIIACSSAVADHVSEQLDLPRAGIDVVFNGVELDALKVQREPQLARRELGLPLDRPIVTLVGRISAQKNQIGLIEAAPEILKRVPDAVFVFAGAPDEAGHLVDLNTAIATHGLERSVVRLGYVEAMPTLYAATDVLAAPSLWEGFGLMLVEAMAAGVPIVATRVGGIPEVVEPGKTALLVEPGRPAALAEAITNLLTSNEIRARMGEAGRERARVFSWDHAVQHVQGIYARVLREKSQ